VQDVIYIIKIFYANVGERAGFHQSIVDIYILECPKTQEKMKSASIVTANLQKVSFVHVDTKYEVLPNLNNI